MLFVAAEITKEETWWSGVCSQFFSFRSTIATTSKCTYSMCGYFLAIFLWWHYCFSSSWRASWLGPFTIVDVTIVSPILAHMPVNFYLGKAAQIAENSKYSKHWLACHDAGYGFLGFAADCFGCLAPETAKMLTRIAHMSYPSTYKFRHSSWCCSPTGSSSRNRCIFLISFCPYTVCS